jgi:class 3 adenylate cyclase
MSSIIYFDIRNFSTHVSYLHSNNKATIVFELISNLFLSLHNIIDKSRSDLGINGTTFINHTGDGFLAIFRGNGKSLQSLFVASLLCNDAQKLIKDYEKKVKRENLTLRSNLDFGIGIHLGPVSHFKYHPKYPKNHQIFAFFGHAINISYRVQETTKDHKFQTICTRVLYNNAIKLIKDEYKDIFIACFTELGKHKLRGGEYNLYGVKNFAQKIKPYMIQN